MWCASYTCDDPPALATADETISIMCGMQIDAWRYCTCTIYALYSYMAWIHYYISIDNMVSQCVSQLGNRACDRQVAEASAFK